MEENKVRETLLSTIIISEDEKQEIESVLDNLVSDTLSEFLVLMRVESINEVPNKYLFIPKNVFKARFSRLGKEGIENYSQSEQSFTYDMSDFKEYSNIIIDFVDSNVEKHGVGLQWF
ncbi:hypothetical protein DOK76_12375 [Vagococcus sp. DIV0080]|uniref:Uncharacterized protein n=1 Tax=Candidatus Vagococcus giribetii TaxID=2230876 RepID=A0ABS3HVT3_9ENTE|nr:phage head-tail connector protein [Vagococcus sp. DIV0080]MBO0477869.1 hypothetical protein [Vagococcus sp. DIV0080]